MSMLLPPGLLLGALLSVCYASLYHLWSGHSLRDLLACLLMAGAGFGVGQLVGIATQGTLGQIGQLHLIEASIGAWLVLFTRHMLIQRRHVN